LPFQQKRLTIERTSGPGVKPRPFFIRLVPGRFFVYYCIAVLFFKEIILRIVFIIYSPVRASISVFQAYKFYPARVFALCLFYTFPLFFYLFFLIK